LDKCCIALLHMEEDNSTRNSGMKLSANQRRRVPIYDEVMVTREIQWKSWRSYGSTNGSNKQPNKP